jgi:hypothetical protein
MAFFLVLCTADRRIENHVWPTGKNQKKPEVGRFFDMYLKGIRRKRLRGRSQKESTLDRKLPPTVCEEYGWCVWAGCSFVYRRRNAE